MIKLLWPALIPLLGLAIYMVWRARRRADGFEMPPIRSKVFFACISSLVIAMGLFIMIGMQQQRSDASHYQPTHLNPDGTLSRGGIK